MVKREGLEADDQQESENDDNHKENQVISQMEKKKKIYPIFFDYVQEEDSDATSGSSSGILLKLALLVLKYIFYILKLVLEDEWDPNQIQPSERRRNQPAMEKSIYYNINNFSFRYF